MNTKEYNGTVYGWWAKRFDCAAADFEGAGTKVIAEEALTEKKSAHLYTIKQAAVLRAPPELAADLEAQTKVDLSQVSLTANNLITLTGKNLSLKNTLLDHFLDQNNFNPQPIPDGFSLRMLDGMRDDGILQDFYAHCTAKDLEEAEIYLDEPDPVIMGLFDGEVMAAYASHRYWDDVLADIGVLVRADYRRRGLGKAVVSALCEWCFTHDVVPMYRVFSYNSGSLRIPQALGFGDVISIESFSITS